MYAYTFLIYIENNEREKNGKKANERKIHVELCMIDQPKRTLVFFHILYINSTVFYLHLYTSLQLYFHFWIVFFICVNVEFKQIYSAFFISFFCALTKYVVFAAAAWCRRCYSNKWILELFFSVVIVNAMDFFPLSLSLFICLICYGNY